MELVEELDQFDSAKGLNTLTSNNAVSKWLLPKKPMSTLASSAVDVVARGKISPVSQSSVLTFGQILHSRLAKSCTLLW